MHPQAQTWIFPCFPASPAAGSSTGTCCAMVLFPHPSGTSERVSWDTPGSGCHCHPRRGQCAEPGEGALAGGCLPSLAQLLMNAGYPSLERGQGQLCVHLTPLPAHKAGHTLLGTHRAIVTPSRPWLGLVPVLFPFSVSPKASGGFQALELCSAKVLPRAGNVWVLNECSRVSLGSWGWL